MHQELPEELIAGLRISDVMPVRGGDIAKAFRVDGPDGTYFLKTHPRPSRQMFEREARGV